MNIAKKWILATVLVGSMVGGAIGGTVLSSAAGNAASKTTTTTTTTSPGPWNGAPRGKFTPNENAAHEQGESAQREAQETAGQFPTVP